MASSRPRLTQLQHDLLHAFFQREKGFFLTGGAALVGFHLGHRLTEDLDLFAVDAETFERGPAVLADAVASLESTMVVRQQAPGFHRYFVTRGEEAVIVDLVFDRVPQLFVDKLEQDGIRIDPPAEIKVPWLVRLPELDESLGLWSLW